MLNLKNISFSFSGKPVLRNVSLKLKKGMVISILGENGSGKSTLLKIIAGLKDPESGIVEYNETKVAGPAEKLIPGHESIKLVFQDFNLPYKHSVEESIRVLLPPWPDQKKEQRVNHLIRLCRLSKIRKKRVEELSGGEKQRVAIARMLAGDPEVILLDEPFSNLDALIREEIKDILFRAIRELNISAILVTHDPSDAFKYTDQLIVMKEGRIIKKGNPQQIYMNPGTLYTARLTGKVNVISCASASTTTVKKQLIRPEEITLVKNHRKGIHGRVTGVFFSGPFYEIEVFSIETGKLKCFSINNEFKPGEEIKIILPQAKTNFLLKRLE